MPPLQIRISAVSVSTVRIPVRAVHSHGIGDVDASTNVILRLDTDAGITGWGEAAPWTVFTGSPEASAAALHVHLRPLLLGADPFRIEALLSAAERTVMHCTEAKAAMEMALFDIVGKALGVSVCTLLGGPVREEIPLSFSIADPDFGRDLELMTQLCRDGVRLFKVKTGFAEHAEDLRRLTKLREALPADAELRVDYNQGLQPWEAMRRLRDIEQFCPAFIEQPVPAEQRAALAAITASLDTPVMADESVFTAADALLVAGQHVADLISIKLQKSGGMLRAREIAAIAAAGGLACYGGDMFETGIACTAGAHLIAATPNISLGCEFYQPTYYLAEDLLTGRIRSGTVRCRCPPGPDWVSRSTRIGFAATPSDPAVSGAGWIFVQGSCSARLLRGGRVVGRVENKRGVRHFEMRKAGKRVGVGRFVQLSSTRRMWLRCERAERGDLMKRTAGSIGAYRSRCLPAERSAERTARSIEAHHGERIAASSGWPVRGPSSGGTDIGGPLDGAPAYVGDRPWSVRAKSRLSSDLASLGKCSTVREMPARPLPSGGSE